MKKTFNHKIIFLILLVIIISFLCFKMINLYNINQEILETNNSINLKENEINKKNNEIKNKKTGEVKAISPEYYINSIMSYAILMDMQVETKVNESKFEDMLQLEIKFKTVPNDVLKDFVVSLSLLGYVEEVKKNSILLNVKGLTVNEAKEIISQNKKLLVLTNLLN